MKKTFEPTPDMITAAYRVFAPPVRTPLEQVKSSLVGCPYCRHDGVECKDGSLFESRILFDGLQSCTGFSVKEEPTKAKYYVGRFCIKIGCRTWSSYYGFTTANDPCETLKNIAKNWFGRDESSGELEGDYYVHQDGDEKHYVRPEDWAEISAKAFDLLMRILDIAGEELHV